MNCAEFESVVLELVRESAAGEEGHAGAMAHTQSCARCAQRLAAEQTMNRALAQIVAEDAALGAPPVVEKILLSAFRERKSGRSERRRAWVVRAAVGVAAMLAVVAVGTWRRPAQPPPVGVTATKPTPKPLRVTAPVYREEHKPPVRMLRTASRKRARAAKREVAGEREIMTDFIPVVYDPTPIKRGQMVRVRLPHAALLAFGLPVNEQHAEESIQADVLLGDDGLARAVRFVK